MDQKVYKGRMKLLDAGEAPAGSFRAVFATLGVIDRDGDITEKGAFTDGQEVRIAQWSHNWSRIPVGKGVIHADDEKAWVDGQFLLETQDGKDHYETVKFLGDLQEWSYAFDILEAKEDDTPEGRVRYLRKLDVFEVSPVMLGAGIGTRTESIKSGARHTAREYEEIQHIHDLAIELGAKCREAEEESEGESDGEGSGKGKVKNGTSPEPSAVALQMRMLLGIH